MRLVFLEIYKVISRKKFWFFLIFGIAINCIFLYQKEIFPEKYMNQKVDLKIFSQLNEDLANFSSDSERLEFVDEKINYLQTIEFTQNFSFDEMSKKQQKILKMYPSIESSSKYFDDPFLEKILFLEASKNLNNIVNYDDFLKEIDNKANMLSNISIFSNEKDFSKRNIIKTAKQYQNMKDIDLKYDIDKGLNMATNHQISDFLAIFLIVFICNILFIYENNKGLFKLIKPCKNGRIYFVLSKLVTLWILSIFLVMTIYGANFICAINTYGLGDLSRSLQSVFGFTGSLMKINVFEYIVLFFCSKAAIYMLLSTIILLICVIVNNNTLINISLFLLAIINILMYTLINSNSSLMFFKYINLISLININSIYSNCRNINIFGYPISIVSIFWIVVFIEIILFSVIIVLVFSRNNIFDESFLKNIFKKIKYKKVIPKSLFTYENYKLYFTNKIILVIIVLTILQIINIYNSKEYLSPEDKYQKAYISKIAGEYTDLKEQKILDDKKNYEDKLAEFNMWKEKAALGEIDKTEFNVISQKYSSIFYYQRLFEENIFPKYQYLKGNYDNGKKLSFVFDKGFNKLIGVDDVFQNNYNTLILTLILIIGYASIFSIEYKNNAIKLVRVYNSKTRLFISKSVTGLIYTIICFIVVYVPYFVKVINLYGSDSLFEPIASIKMFSNYPENINILQYLIFVYSVKFIVFLLIMLTIFALSIFFKDYINTIIIATALFATSFLLNYCGINLLNNFTLHNCMYTFNMFINNGSVANKFNIIYLSLPVSMSILSLIHIKKKL